MSSSGFSISGSRLANVVAAANASSNMIRNRNHFIDDDEDEEDSTTSRQINHMMGDDDDPISASLDGHFEGGDFYTSRREQRRPTRNEMFYGYDMIEEEEEERPRKKSSKLIGGIQFVLGSTLHPEKSLNEQDDTKKNGTTSTMTTQQVARVEEGEISMEGDETQERPSFQQLRLAKSSSSSSSSRSVRQRERDEVEEEERRMAGRGGLGLGIGFTSTSTAAASSSPSPPIPKPAPAKLDKDFASFTKHGTGFGLRMLSKLGYQPGDRLGKHGTGVAQPIIAKLRPQGIGLGYGGFQEVDKSVMARNAQEEEEFAREKEEAKKKKKKEEEEKTKQNQIGWKDGNKGKVAKTKRVYKTAQDLLNEDTQKVGETPTPSPMIIMDYRGPTARVTSLDTLTSTNIETSSTPQMLPELQHNLRLLVSMAEDSLRLTDRERNLAKQRIQQLDNERELLEESIEYEEKRMINLETIVGLIEKTAKELKNIATATSTSTSSYESLNQRIQCIIQLLRTIHSQYPQEYVTYDIPSRSIPMIYPLMKTMIQQWEPFGSYVIGEENEMNENDEKKSANVTDSKSNDFAILLLNILSQLKPLLSIMSPPNSSTSRTISIYNQLLDELLLPKIRLELSQIHMSIRQTEPIIKFLNFIRDACTPEMHQKILVQLIVVKLEYEVNHWNPRNDTQPVHTWILPYSSILPSSHMNKLYEMIRLKLSIVLQEWLPHDLSAILVLTPWFNVFTSEQFDSLLLRSILPKLRNSMKSFLVNPAKQDLTSFHAILPWCNLLATSSTNRYLHSSSPPSTVYLQLRSMLLSEFFPKWINALFRWLGGGNVPSNDSTVSPDFEEIGVWYREWKKLMPSILINDPIIQGCFTRGLDLINHAMSDESISSPYQQTIEWMKTMSTSNNFTLPTNISSTPLSTQTKETVPSVLIGDSDNDSDATFLANILRFATHHGIDFVPALKKGSFAGRQIHLFGSNQVYVRDGVIYIKPEGVSTVSTWEPISLADLLQRTKSVSSSNSSSQRGEPNLKQAKQDQTSSIPMNDVD